MAKGLPIETQCPIIENVHNVAEACNVKHADFVTEAKHIDKCEKATIKGDSYIGSETVINLNYAAAHSQVSEGWTYKISEGGTLNAGSIPVSEGDIVKFHNNIWIKMNKEEVQATYIQDFLTPNFALLKHNYDKGTTCFIKDGANSEIYVLFPCYLNNGTTFQLKRVEHSGGLSILIKEYELTSTSNGWTLVGGSTYLAVPAPPLDLKDYVLHAQGAQGVHWEEVE